MPLIREAIVVTTGPDGRPHLAPLGLIERPDALVLAPFRPSTTLANLERHPFACACYTDDVRVFAGCVTGKSATGRRSPRRAWRGFGSPLVSPTRSSRWWRWKRMRCGRAFAAGWSTPPPMRPFGLQPGALCGDRSGDPVFASASVAGRGDRGRICATAGARRQNSRGSRARGLALARGGLGPGGGGLSAFARKRVH